MKPMKLRKHLFVLPFLSLFILGLSCDKDNNEEIVNPPLPDPIQGADVVSVSVSKLSTNLFQFNVGIFSPDIDCSQYANWWEVVSEDGVLIGRRILAHSHVPPNFPQPFVRGASISIDSTTVVWIRGHMNTTGYKDGKAFRGSLATGFSETSIPDDFALDLDNEVPNCAF